MMFFTPGKTSLFGTVIFSTTIRGFTSMDEMTVSGPSASFTALTQLLFTEFRNGSFDFSGTRTMAMPSSDTEMSPTIPSDTMSLPLSGWVTFLSALRTCSFIDMIFGFASRSASWRIRD